MGIKEKLMKPFLNKSNSYRYYKNYYDAHNGPNYKKELNDLKKEFAKFKKENDKFKRDTNEYIASANYLLNNIFLDFSHEPKKPLQNIKSLCAELLVFVDKICKKHDIQWWLDGGNCLGAVRHGDFVPWDDDVDIGMVRKDYNRFIKIIYDEVEANNLRDFIDIDYRRKGIDGNLVNTFMQLWIKRPVDDRSSILGGVDIFPFDYITAFHYDDLNKVYHDSREKYYRNLDNKMSYEDSLDILFKDLGLSMDETDWIVPGVEGSFGLPREVIKLRTFDRTKIFPLKETQFGDHIFPIPNDPDYYLRKIYGKYMDVPKSVRRHNRIGRFRYVKNADVLFEECLARMREANENFE